MYTQANKAIEDDDEEMAYVYLMKYFQLIEFCQKAKDFKREEQFIRKLLGKNTDIRARMDRLQKIQKSLIERYEEKRCQMPSIPASNININNVSAPISSENMNENSSETTNKSLVLQKSIECGELYHLMNDANVSMLIMDCRIFDDFEASHLKYQNILNVPENIIKKG